MLWNEAEVLEDKIRDLQRILDADNALLEVTQSPERRLELIREVGDLQGKIDGLRDRIENLGVD